MVADLARGHDSALATGSEDHARDRLECTLLNVHRYTCVDRYPGRSGHAQLPFRALTPAGCVLARQIESSEADHPLPGLRYVVLLVIDYRVFGWCGPVPLV
jgi:hypothetical protein